MCEVMSNASWEFDAKKGRERIDCVLDELRKKMNPNMRQVDAPKLFPSSIKGTIYEKSRLIADVYAGIRSDDKIVQLENTRLFRDMLFIAPKATLSLSLVTNSGIVHRLAEFLMREDQPELQFMGACVLERIVPGISKNTKVGINGKYAQIFVNLLKYADDDIREQAVWGMGIVIVNYPSSCGPLLRSGALDHLLAQIKAQNKKRVVPSMLLCASHTLLVFCREKPHLPLEQINRVVSALHVLVRSDKLGVLSNACWALSYLTDGTNDKSQSVNMMEGLFPRLVVLLKHPSPDVFFPALRTVGYITAGDDCQKQDVIKHGALPCLLSLLTSNHEDSIKRLACRTIANITAGNKEQIQSVIEAELISPLVTLLRRAEFDIKKEAARAISNATSRGTCDQIMYLVSQGCIHPLYDLLFCSNPMIVPICRKGLENIMKVGELEKKNTGDVNIYAQLISSAGGLENSENLLSRDNKEIFIHETCSLEDHLVFNPDDGPQPSPLDLY